MTDRREERDRERRERRRQRRKAREAAERRLDELREAWRRRREDGEEKRKNQPVRGREGADAPLVTTPPEPDEPRGAGREPAPKIRRRRRRLA